MKRSAKFYNFARDITGGERELFIDGEIAKEAWFGDETTPQAFKKELFADKTPLTLWINSPGGDVFAAAEIYAFLAEYPADITVKIYGLCASAASLIAMAGTKILMSPPSLMVIHNPWTVAVGERRDMEKAAVMLDEIKASIINTYALKTGLPHAKISRLMDVETPMSAQTAVALGFADGMIESENPAPNTAFNRTISSCYAEINNILQGRTSHV